MIRIRTVLFLLLFYVTVFCDKTKFSEVYDGGGFVCVDSVFSIGEEISILDIETGNITKATVVRDTQYQDLEIEMIFPTMIIKTKIKPDVKSDRFIAFNINIKAHKIINLEYIDCAFQEFTASDSLIKMALTRDVGCAKYDEDGLDTAYCQKCSIEGYELYRTRINGLKAGPQFIKIDGKFFILNSPCAFKGESAFQLNGKLYFYSGSGGCECGAFGLELHEISKEGIKARYESWKWSM
jgi:hypothetical protein